MNQYSLKSVFFKKLKGLNNVTIDFSDALTAIMGVNGSGKTTVIHALACLYQPAGEKGEYHRFSEFFVPNTDALWNGSELIAENEDKSKKECVITKKFHKDNYRWEPKYETRLKRDVYYIGIDTCLPDVEKNTKNSRIAYKSEQLIDKVSEKTKRISAYVLNKNYTKIYDNTYKKSHFQGVELESGLKYSSLSMGSGEQRVLKIIKTILSADPYSLLLIDEIDLLLHVSALRRLIEQLYSIAKDKHIQVVFTTHSLEMMSMNQMVKIQYIANCRDGSSLVYDRITTDLIFDMSGLTKKTNHVYVEDDFAKSIVKQLLYKKGLTASTEIVKFGAIENAFTIAATMVIEGRTLDSYLVVLDGDKYKSENDKETQIAKKLTGTEVDSNDKRKAALNIVTQFVLPEKDCPERFVYEIIKNHFPKENEIYIAANEICAVNDSHDWICRICRKLDKKVDEIVREVFCYAYDSEDFREYLSNIEKWLDAKKEISMPAPNGSMQSQEVLPRGCFTKGHDA